MALSGNVTDAQLCIGSNGDDTVVNEYHDMSAVGGTGAASVALNAMFDSTHFKDKTKIKLTLKVWDTNGGHFEVEVAGPAYNKGLLLENNVLNTKTMGGIANELASSLKSMANYSATPSSSYQKMDIINAISGNTLFFINSHGAPGDFGDCDALESMSKLAYGPVKGLKSASADF